MDQLGLPLSYARERSSAGTFVRRTHCKRGHLLAQTRRTTAGGHIYCIECHRQNNRKFDAERPIYRLRKRYGLSPESYAKMLADQRDRCAICGDEMEKPRVDHDHDSGHVRALLCPRCNTGLGQFGESAELLREAAAYLEFHRCNV